MAGPKDLLAEARGMAHASTSLCFGLATLLFKKGLITKGEFDGYFEGVLESLEKHLDPKDPATKVARGLVDGMARVAATAGRLAPKTKRT
jgi:hypothetical protein